MLILNHDCYLEAGLRCAGKFGEVGHRKRVDMYLRVRTRYSRPLAQNRMHAMASSKERLKPIDPKNPSKGVKLHLGEQFTLPEKLQCDREFKTEDEAIAWEDHAFRRASVFMDNTVPQMREILHGITASRATTARNKTQLLAKYLTVLPGPALKQPSEKVSPTAVPDDACPAAVPEAPPAVPEAPPAVPEAAGEAALVACPPLQRSPGQKFSLVRSPEFAHCLVCHTCRP